MTAKNILDRLEQDIFPACGMLPIDDVEPGDLLAALRTVEGPQLPLPNAVDVAGARN
jgi:hypothetical protein